MSSSEERRKQLEQEMAVFLAKGKSVEELPTPHFGKPKPPAPIQILTDGTPIKTPARNRRKPMKMVIGVTGPHAVRTRDAVNILLTALNLSHINMRHPMIQFSAECLGLEPHYVEHHVPLHHYYPAVKQTLGDMQKTLEHFLCMSNKNYLIEKVAKEMEEAELAFQGGLNNGYIVSNLTTENEADWIRKNKGIVIHIRDDDSLVETIPLEQFPTDELIITSRNTAPHRKSLSGIIKKIAEHFQLESIKSAA